MLKKGIHNIYILMQIGLHPNGQHFWLGPQAASLKQFDGPQMHIDIMPEVSGHTPPLAIGNEIGSTQVVPPHPFVHLDFHI